MLKGGAYFFLANLTKLTSYHLDIFIEERNPSFASDFTARKHKYIIEYTNIIIYSPTVILRSGSSSE